MRNGSTILVVDDDDSLREAVSDALESDGYHVVRARNGEAALKVLRGTPRPCVMVLDLMMPAGGRSSRSCARTRSSRECRSW
jgi:CheY-like chemotaxis protein